MTSLDVTLELIRRLEAVEAEQKRLASTLPLFPVWNQAEDENLTADQTNYPLGDYGIINLIPTAGRTIRGITGGTRGRVLFLRNASGINTITFTSQDALATAENRILTPSNANVILGFRQTAIFYYVDSNVPISTDLRWLMMFPIA